MFNPQDYRQLLRESTGIRLAVLFGSFFLLLTVTSLIGLSIENSEIGTQRDRHLMLSVIQCVLAFCLPAFLLGKFCSGQALCWLKLNKTAPIKTFLGVIFVYILSLPAMEWLIEWNNNMHLPESLSGLEETLRGWETKNSAITENLLNAKGWFQVFIGILVIGVLTGFSEELFFRGGLQGIFSRINIGIFWAIFISAFIFSLMHFQFYGFFPRLVMGLFFGYLVVWADSLWPAVFAHALNNGLIVFLSGITGDSNFNLFEEKESLYGDWFPIASLIITIIFFIYFRGYFFKKEIKEGDRWQKNQAPRTTGQSCRK